MWECGGIFILHEEVDYMLTPKQNMLEVIKGGNPDRFVNQYEAVQLLFHPFMFANPLLQPGQENVVNAYYLILIFMDHLTCKEKAHSCKQKVSVFHSVIKSVKKDTKLRSP